MTDEEIREICREWARGEHFPVDDVDEQHLAAAIASDPAQWWTVVREVIEESSNVGYAENLSWVVASVIGVRGRAWRATVVEEARGSAKATRGRHRCLVDPSVPSRGAAGGSNGGI